MALLDMQAIEVTRSGGGSGGGVGSNASLLLCSPSVTSTTLCL